MRLNLIQKGTNWIDKKGALYKKSDQSRLWLICYFAWAVEIIEGNCSRLKLVLKIL